MKKPLLLSLFFTLLIAFPGQAQDIILKVTGEEIKAKVIEITPALVLYKLPDLTQDSLYSLARKEVFMVTFANGAKEVLQQESLETVAEALTPTQMALLGRKEARLYYKPKGIMAASAVTTWLFWPAVIGLAAVPPKIKPSQVSNTGYLSDPNFTKAYKRQAQKRKLGQVAIGTGIGVATFSVAMLVMVSQMGH